MNLLLQKELDKISTLLDITEYQMHKLAECIYKDMTNKTMLKMLPTYCYSNVDVPDGEYLSIDFGGSNIRCNKFKVKKQKLELIKCVAFSLCTEEKDYTTSEYTLKDIINLIVDKLETIIDKDKEYMLGHTFSFATYSTSKSCAKIVGAMTKGFELRESEDADVNAILKDIIKERNLKIEPISIINDTTATLLTANFYNKNADIAMIIGTGHNACFTSKTGEVINIESGYMNDGIPLSYFDYNLLDKLKDEEKTVLEFLTGGKYLGSIAEEITNELFEAGFIKNKLQITSTILSKSISHQLGNEYEEEEKEVIKQVADMIFKRVAKFVTAEIIAILKYTDEDLEKEHCIVFDGSVYEKNKILQDYIKMYIEKTYGDNAKKIETMLIKDASAVGAIISIFPLN